MAIHLFWYTNPKDNDYKAYQFSNQEIVKNFELEFGKYDDVIWHDSNSRGRVTDNPDDILIGSPPWPNSHLKDSPYESWVFDNGFDGDRSAHPNTFIVFPFSSPTVPSHAVMDPVVPSVLASRGFFGLGGTVHYDHCIEHAPADSIWRRVQPKLIRSNMGCDTRLLTHKQASAPRTNGLFHISSLRGYKRPEHMLNSLPRDGCQLFIGTERTDLLEDIAEKGLVPPNVTNLGLIDNGEPETNEFILKECSYYLHCSREAQATAILENCARGLVPLLTPFAGFTSPDAIYLSEDDAEANRRTIAEALAMPDDEYKARQRGVRSQVRLYHSWERICQLMYASMKTLIAGGNVSRRGEDLS